MAAPYPSSSRMDTWDQRRGLQTMNLRSVFTIEQQRILERYYDNGMTNQSKACFQLILQCAQEAKLDFSVVRTWVGNKRRKIASRVDQNGVISHTLSSLSAGLLSNHTLSGGTLSNPSLVPGPLLHSDVLTARSIPNRVHLFPHSSNFKIQTPNFTTASSSPSSSSSPLTVRGNANNNNNDVILTGTYSLNSAERPRQRPAAAPPPQLDSPTSFNVNLAVQNKNNSSVLPLQSIPVSLAQNPTLLSPSSGPLVHTAARKSASSSGETGVNIGTSIIPQSWTRQYGTANTLPWSNNSTSQIKTQPRPHSNPQPQSTANTVTPQKVKVSVPVQNSSPPSATPCIQQVFTLSEKSEWNKLVPVRGTAGRQVQESRRPATGYLDTSNNFSIAMETGDEEDEWQREEELANMAAQTYIQRERRSPSAGEVCSRSSSTQPTTSSKSTAVQSDDDLHGYEAVAAQTSFVTESSSQTSVSASADPWIVNNSRKRTLQDRTQFSDGDLVQLKRYWDRGMTSLGSVCKDKINAAANELNVDTEIVKTWISNRRRKYRLMGIEIPPPRGGPAVFTTSSPGNESPVALSPDVDRLQTPDLTDDTNDGLSEDGSINSHNRDAEDDIDMSTAPLAINVKIEVSDDDEDVNDDGVDMMASDLEQMQSLLEFKHEEVQFLEHELENQKQRYQELASFTKSLLIAVRKKDLERQQELIDSLPPSSDQDWDLLDEDIQTPGSPSADDCTDHRGSPGSCVGHSPLPNEDINTKVHTVTEPSASEGKD
ncbi:highly divergent homeobox [Eucyclogobius newberryi]|uniref:highly divergent homeobox n=1 Tax=Eucyclogobius newberryi TaxID=166745 RepID=UPI003B5B41A7